MKVNIKDSYIVRLKGKADLMILKRIYGNSAKRISSGYCKSQEKVKNILKDMGLDI